MKENGEPNRAWSPSLSVLTDKVDFEALVRSRIYQDFTAALADLAGLRVTLAPPSPSPASKRSVPVYRAGQLAGVLQITWGKATNSRNKRSMAATTLAEILAKDLELISNSAELQPRNAEPPVMQRARDYIQKHYKTNLSLSKTAISLNVSKFYLCKLFRRATGFTFSQCVARTRVARASELLLDPRLRISEIAFEVGFQSLTHFNRAFRRTLSCSPTEYRKRTGVSTVALQPECDDPRSRTQFPNKTRQIPESPRRT
jgi:AraC-like DNA-binding protein